MGDPAPNAWCLVHGPSLPGGTFIEGPFATEQEAQANADADLAANPSRVPIEPVVLVNPANC